jgi:hypothetical protein
LNTKTELVGAVFLVTIILFVFVSFEQRNSPELEKITGRVASTVFVLEKSTQMCNLSLEKDWNLIELRCIPNDATASNVFQGHLSNILSIHTYKPLDSEDHWKAYSPGLPAWVVQDLSSIDRKEGYWINMKSAENISIVGYYIQPLTLYLYSGWNLMGFPLKDDHLINESLSSISGTYSLIYGYNASDLLDPWKVYDPNVDPALNDLIYFAELHGYWINMTQNTSLYAGD